MSSNPFIHSTLFLGRQHERKQLVRYISRGESVLLIGGRRAGKTRLLAQLYDVSRKIVDLDAGSWPLNNENVVLIAIGKGLGRECHTRQQLRRALEESAPLCVVIDEADRLLTEPWAAGLLAWMRSIIGPKSLGSRVSFVLAGGPALSGYRNPEDFGSPPLNLSERLYLRPLDDDARRQFARLGGDAVDPSTLAKHAGGHPWLLERVLRELADGMNFDDALEAAFDHCHETFPLWRRQLGIEGVSLVLNLPPNGVPRAEFQSGTWARHRAAMVRARHLCLLREEGTGSELRYLPGPSLFLDWLRGAPTDTGWDLAISYASEDEPLAKQIKRELQDDYRVFFAPDEDAYLWGKDLDDQLPRIYGVESRFTLVLSTESYVQKHWTRVEFDAALLRGASLLVVDLGALPNGMPTELIYRTSTPEGIPEVIDALRRKLALPS